MHSPHSVQALRAGPAPPKYGSATVPPGFAFAVPSASLPSPKKTPTGARWKVSPTPMTSAVAFRWTSDGVIVGLSLTPSIRLACS